MIYLACFAVSVLLAFFANRAEKRWKFLALSVVSILVTVALAGLRDYSIGIDVKNYFNMERFWAGAIKSDSLWDYLRAYISGGYREPLFALFLGSIAQLTGSYRVFLWAAHAVIVTGVYIGAFRQRKRVEPALVLLLFYLLYYNNSLNIIRQYMAVALLFAVFADLEQRKFVRYVIVTVVASLIHTTALLGLVPLAVTLILYPKKEITTASNKRILMVCILGIVGAAAFIPMIKLLMQIGILGTKYSFYFKQATGRLSLTRTGLLVLELGGIALCYKKLRETVPHIEYYLVHTVAFMCFQALSTQIYYGHRLVVYFALGNIVMLLMLPKTLKTPMLRGIGYAAVTGFSLYFWYYLYVAALSSETFPYAFFW